MISSDRSFLPFLKQIVSRRSLPSPRRLGAAVLTGAALLLLLTGSDTVSGADRTDSTVAPLPVVFASASSKTAAKTTSSSSAKSSATATARKNKDSSTDTKKKTDSTDGDFISLPDRSKTNTVTAGQDAKTEEPVKVEYTNAERLPGVFYDLRRVSKGLDVVKLKGRSAPQFSETLWEKTLSDFVLGHWMNSTDYDYTPQFIDFTNYYCYPQVRYDSYFYRTWTAAEIQNFFDDKESSTTGWVAIHAGNVVAPFSGYVRFVGYGDDVLAVQFDNKLVLDYGNYLLGQKKNAGTAKGRPLGAFLQNGKTNSLYENIETCKFEDYTMAKGLMVQVVKGNVYPIKIMYSMINGTSCSVALFFEMLNASGKPLPGHEDKLYLFRTTMENPNDTSESFTHPYIWRVRRKR